MNAKHADTQPLSPNRRQARVAVPPRAVQLAWAKKRGSVHITPPHHVVGYFASGDSGASVPPALGVAHKVLTYILEWKCCCNGVQSEDAWTSLQLDQSRGRYVG